MTKLKNFFNEVSNNNRVFTAEEIGSMTKEEFAQQEKAIDYQMMNLGIPQSSDLAGSSDVVYVQSYTRSDGTQVKAHYRSKSDRGGSFGGQTTGAAASGDWSEVLSDPQNYMKKILQASMEDNSNYLKGNVTLNDYQKAAHDFLRNSERFIGKMKKRTLDGGVNLIGWASHQEDARAMWNMASDSLGIYNNDYVNKNGKVFEGVDDLGDNYNPYKEKIKEKIKSQFGKDDVPGVVFHENSSPANAINKSKELKDFVNKNMEALKSGKEVTGSISFQSNSNLHNAFGKADILSAKVNNGYVEVKILDTYDFNKDDKSKIVKAAYSVQKVGLLNPYYTIVKCKYKL